MREFLELNRKLRQEILVRQGSIRNAKCTIVTLRLCISLLSIWSFPSDGISLIPVNTGIYVVQRLFVMLIELISSRNIDTIPATAVQEKIQKISNEDNTSGGFQDRSPRVRGLLFLENEHLQLELNSTVLTAHTISILLLSGASQMFGRSFIPCTMLDVFFWAGLNFFLKNNPQPGEFNYPPRMQP